MSLEELEKLDSKMESFLARYEELRTDRERLAGELDAAQSRVRELEERLEACRRERVVMKERVERILGRLDVLNVS